jgi:hypothetical protein
MLPETLPPGPEKPSPDAFETARTKDATSQALNAPASPDTSPDDLSPSTPL